MLAALAAWDYCEASAKFIFGDSLGNSDADKILAALRANPQGLTRTEIRDLFGRNRSEPLIHVALTALEERGLAQRVSEQTGGRPTERWIATSQDTTKTT
jgi:predicted ArsR family transcriptional regulator